MNADDIDAMLNIAYAEGRKDESDARQERIKALEEDVRNLRQTLQWLDKWLGAKPMTQCVARIRLGLENKQ